MNNTINYTKIIEKIGEGTTKVSESLIKKLSEWGLTIEGLPVKIISILVLLGMIFLATKISQKVIKILMIILSVVLIGSVVYSIFV